MTFFIVLLWFELLSFVALRLDVHYLGYLLLCFGFVAVYLLFADGGCLIAVV